MNEFEKVEKLREKADVTFEEAKEALENANGDLLDAMIYLEKNGKTVAKETVNKTVSGETSELTVKPSCTKNKEWANDFKGFVKKVWQKGCDNYFVVTKKDDVIGKLPVWVFVLCLLAMFWVTVPALIIGLFFEFHYKFMGKDDLSFVNNAFDKASDAAEKVKDEFTKKQ